MSEHAFELYVCPRCRGPLQAEAGALRCGLCQIDYPVRDGIPDFVLVSPQEDANPFLHGFGKILAPVYESPLWFPVVLRLLGGWDAPTLSQITESVKNKMRGVDGLVLDLATGTGTYGRHIAGARRTVYGIDISMEMIRRGQRFVEQEGIENMYFARADGGALPFADCVFEGCLFCGSLHIFRDTRRVLKEVGRTLKGGARVVVTTVIHGDKGIFKERGSRRPDPPNIKVFDLPELKVDIEESGFTHFDPEVHGCLLMFGMTKK